MSPDMQMRRGTALRCGVASIALALASVAACGGEPQRTAAESAPPPPASEVPAPAAPAATPAVPAATPGAPEAQIPVGLAVGNRAPDFEATDVTGVRFRLSDYRGKVVVVDFWGFW